ARNSATATIRLGETMAAMMLCRDCDGRDQAHAGCSEHEAGQLIERIGDFRTHDDERRDHQKEAKSHQIRKPNILLRLSRGCEAPGTKFNTHWVMTAPLLGRAAAGVNHFQPSC
ncbi:MAG TPA: hypothetical protein VEU94_08010, partial [Terriglobales bacterium]|nr:hypothetical protein [Terriglobales bacterium]